jgi:hypothetical protein
VRCRRHAVRDREHAGGVSGSDSAADQRASVRPLAAATVGTTRSRATIPRPSLLASTQHAIDAGSDAIAAAG